MFKAIDTDTERQPVSMPTGPKGILMELQYMDNT
jgi:hypothetical protein